MIYVKKELEPRQIFKDKEGRFIVVEIMMNCKKALIVTIYAPNGAKEFFFEELTQQLDQVTYEQIIVVGDFSGTVDNQMDRKVKKTKM